MKHSLLSPLNIPEGLQGDWRLVKKTEPANTPFKLRNMRTTFFGGPIQPKKAEVSWPHETTWHLLQEGGGTWMSDIPMEHAQMLQCIKGMRGKVLVGGLGLGLVAVLLAQRKSVSKVLVVEIQKEVVDLVAPHIQHPKIEMVNTDLFEYLKCTGPKAFDYSFYDIWQSDGEGTFFATVCPLYELSEGRIKHKPVNWNEDIMRGQLFQSIQSKLWFMAPEAIEKFGDKLFHTKKKPWEHDGTEEPWWNWSVPYFQWWHDVNPTKEEAEQGAKFYATIYGTWRWEQMWSVYSNNLVGSHR